MAGKTGTSEKVGQASDEYMVSFIGFAPADDPQIAVLVILDSPSKDCGVYISGGGMAAPVVGSIFADVLPYLGVKRSYAEAETDNNAAVPGIRGMGVSEAEEKLKSLGFNVKTVGGGDKVTDQTPTANVRLAVGSTVIIYAGKKSRRIR